MRPNRGTLEWYQHIYINEGLSEMIKAIIEIMKEANEGSVTVERLDLFVKAILYGANPDGTVRILPVEPDPFDITRDPFKWKLDNRVWHSYIQSRNKKR